MRRIAKAGVEGGVRVLVSCSIVVYVCKQAKQNGLCAIGYYSSISKIKGPVEQLLRFRWKWKYKMEGQSSYPHVRAWWGQHMQAGVLRLLSAIRVTRTWGFWLLDQSTRVNWLVPSKVNNNSNLPLRVCTFRCISCTNAMKPILSPASSAKPISSLQPFLRLC